MKPTLVSLHPPITHDHANDEDVPLRVEWGMIAAVLVCAVWFVLACIGAVTVWGWV
jgi:hypothetical protein